MVHEVLPMPDFKLKKAVTKNKSTREIPEGYDLNIYHLLFQLRKQSIIILEGIEPYASGQNNGATSVWCLRIYINNMIHIDHYKNIY